MVDNEELVLDRAFPKAMALISSQPESRVGDFVTVGWHSLDVDPATGPAGVVRIGGPLDPDLIGEVLRLTFEGHELFVLVLGARDVDADLSVSRRAFMELGLLARETVDAVVEVCL